MQKGQLHFYRWHFHLQRSINYKAFFVTVEIQPNVILQYKILYTLLRPLHRRPNQLTYLSLEDLRNQFPERALRQTHIRCQYTTPVTNWPPHISINTRNANLDRHSLNRAVAGQELRHSAARAPKVWCTASYREDRKLGVPDVNAVFRCLERERTRRGGDFKGAFHLRINGKLLKPSGHYMYPPV